MYFGGTDAPAQGIMVPTMVEPLPGGAQGPAARRKLKMPPPEAGAAPERTEVKAMILPVSCASVRPPKAPALLYWTWRLRPPGVPPPPPPPLVITNRVLAQALEESPAGRSEQVVFCASDGPRARVERRAKAKNSFFIIRCFPSPSAD